jgi:hypothetical protein
MPPPMLTPLWQLEQPLSINNFLITHHPQPIRGVEQTV